MGRKGPPQKKASWAALDTVQDTGSTTGESRASRKETSEKLDPPFRPEEEPFFDAALLMRLLKVGGGVAMFFITVVLPVVWYASKLDSRVDVIQGNVTEIKQKTDDLVRDSVQYGGRLGVLEKAISNNVLERASTHQEGDKKTAAQF